jgi:hypothetical protein
MNPMSIMRLKPLLEQFQARHPKFIQFFGYAGQNITDGSLLEISVTTADGKKMITNMHVTSEDIALFHELKDLIH